MPPRLTKRLRRSEIPVDHGLQAEDKHKKFTVWARERGVEINGVAPHIMHGRGIGLVTTRRVKEGERILFVPENAMFKPDFAAMQRLEIQHASPQAKLAMSVILAFRPGAPIATWQDTWPVVSEFEASMPAFWDPLIARHLPPSAQTALQRQLADYEKDWRLCEEHIAALKISEEQFRYFWMIVNSRSFHWAPPRPRSGFMVLCPFIDYINHTATGDSCDVLQRSDGYEVVAQRKYGVKEEIFATYGAHSNEKLLVQYGFILPYAPTSPSADDEIRIDKEVLTVLSDNVKQQLSDLGYLGPFALIPSRGDDGRTTGWELCFKTQVAIRAKLLTCNEWEYFASTGEDIGDDMSTEVFNAMTTVLTELVVASNQHADEVDGAKPENMTDTAFKSARELTKQRWKQIADSVEAFLQGEERTT